MSILIKVLIVKMIIFKSKYKNLGFWTMPNPNRFRSKISKTQMGLTKKKSIFGTYKIKSKPDKF